MRARKQQLTLGRVVATRRAVAALGRYDIMVALARYVQGDWGEVNPEDRRDNDLSVVNGDRVLSAYSTIDGGTEFWVITEADRSTTTVLLPDEY